MPGAEKSKVGDGHVGDMAVASQVVGLRGFEVGDGQKWAGRPAGVPGEYVTVGVAAGDSSMVRRDGDGCDGTRFDG